ncbi:MULTISPECIES: biotin synthase BioB [unclassified Imperialibacter]|uniref:biotin synthase BioB n=1 Tax=unclassified Imperialibacter TaxID=2629706 RepID=UPI0012535847|nr:MULTISPECIES: biotin synthase BioB [unclassified Imperialibacter]CAD5299193.1 biotin synthase [Imperialibacter sp. 89]CAD5299759.1 biotin synthase [Imperialibacter sp. 75]VVT20843.1 biotin synthase [Imperialibacter sp. EC-SDR9]
MTELRNNWTRGEIEEIYNSPMLDLIYRAATVHREYSDPQEVQVCTLLSVKTGGCPEDCSYCPQAARYHTDVKVQKLMEVDEVLSSAKAAKENGSTRFCMGAAWREVRDNKDFDKVIEMVKGVNQMGMEVCCTLGMITESQAKRLKEAGLYAYNHNLDTSEEAYEDIITTRTYKDRLDTLENVRTAKISVCSGGIIGMGESHLDRVGMLHTLATLPEHPESVPVNALVAVEGTPLEDQERVPVWDMIRMIATARIIMPRAMVRLSAGRVNMTVEEQALCFLAGANSIFAGDKLLTTPNPEVDADKQMFQVLNLKPRASFKGAAAEKYSMA